MKKVLCLMVLALLSTALLVSCSGDGNGTQPATSTAPVLGTPVSAPTVSPVTSFGQSLVSHDTGTDNGSTDPFVGQPNVWDIDSDFSLMDGNDDQFDWALRLTVGTTPFPGDQTYAELTFYGPLMSAAEGVKVAAVSDGASMGVIPTGNYSAFLNATSDSRLQTTVDLTSGTTGTVLLYWKDSVSLNPGTMTGFTPQYRVVVRDLQGNELQELYAITTSGMSAQYVDITAYAGQRIVISFEQRNMTQAWQLRSAVIDDVSVRDNNFAGAERVTNGTFETGDLTGWSTNANAAAEVQNMTSGERTLEGLKVKRSFYTVPNKLWGRWVDVFENPSLASAVTATVTYSTNLGSDSCGVIYETPGTAGKALTSWDSTWDDRDIGLVSGLASSQTYTSTTLLNPLWVNGSSYCDGSDNIVVKHVITVPAGGRAALVHFVIMGSYDTGLTATGVAARASEIDAAASAIVNNFWTDGQYRTGMTQDQIDAIKNF